MTGFCTPSARARRAARPAPTSGRWMPRTGISSGNTGVATAGANNTKAFAMFEDMIYYPAGDTIVALDARTGTVRWETVAAQGGRLSSGLIMAGDKIISGRTCGGTPRQASCYIAAHDARTGKELWKFHTAAGADDPIGDKSWGGAPVDGRSASTWGLTGSYDPVKKIIYWGVANPTPNTRAARHGGNSNAIGMSAPADLYSNSTVALNPETGKLLWYYQHLPRRRLGSGLHQRTNSPPNGIQSGPQGCEMDQSLDCQRLAARYLGVRR